MTLRDQLHNSATHKPGFDPACPACIRNADTAKERHKRFGIFLNGALAALSQPATLPADVVLAKSLIRDALAEAGLIVDGYDYTNQAWFFKGVYVTCGHPSSMNCQCFGRLHAGEAVRPDAEVR